MSLCRASPPRNADGLLQFIKDQLAEDTSFARLNQMDPFAKKMMGAAADEYSRIIEDAKAQAAKVVEEDKASAEVYVRYLNKIADKGVEYVENELRRLHKLIDSGMSSAKLVEVNKKISVLGAFSEVANDDSES